MKNTNTPTAGDGRLIIQALTEWLPLKITLAVCAAIILALLTYSNHNVSASAYVTLNYEGASEGLYINGTRFNMYDIKDDAILESAIHSAGLDGKLSVDRLSGWVDVAPRYTRSPENGYIGTEYRVTLYSGYDLGMKAGDMLTLICRAFSDSVCSSYLSNMSVLSYAAQDTDELDYSAVSELFDTRISLISSYLNKRINESGGFTSTETGETFSSLLARLKDIESISLEKYSALIDNNGLSADKTTRLARLSYNKRSLQFDYDGLMIHYNVLCGVVDKYDLSQTAVVLIPIYDELNEFYMSRTKTAVDNFTADAKNYLNKANDILQKINENERLKRNIYAAPASGTDEYEALTAKADAMISIITASLNRLTDIIRLTDDDYISSKIGGSIMYSVGKKSLIDEWGLKRAGMGFVAVMAACTAFQWCYAKYEWRDKLKKLLLRKPKPAKPSKPAKAEK